MQTSMESKKVVLEEAASGEHHHTTVKVAPPPPITKGTDSMQIIFISAICLLQLVLVIAKVNNDASGSWGAWFIPLWLLLFVILLYMLFHTLCTTSYYGRDITLKNETHRTEKQNAKIFLQIAWRFLFWA